MLVLHVPCNSLLLLTACSAIIFECAASMVDLSFIQWVDAHFSALKYFNLDTKVLKGSCNKC